MKKVKRDSDLVVIVNKKAYSPTKFLEIAEFMLDEHAVVRENGRTLAKGPVWKILMILDSPGVRKTRRRKEKIEKRVIDSFDNAIWPLFNRVERGKSPLSEFEKIVEGRK